MSHPDKVSNPLLYTVALRVEDPVEAFWLEGKIDAFWNERAEQQYEYSDNFSLHRKGDLVESHAADSVDEHRCCGIHYEDWGPSPRGHTYVYAFDYGH